MTESPPRNIKKLALPPDLIPFAHQLISAVRTESIAGVKALLEAGAPAWFQDEELGWSCLHYAAEKRNPQLLQTLIKGGAVWNAVDKWGQTAGEICLSLGDQEGWEMIRNEGIRTGGFNKQRRRGSDKIYHCGVLSGLASSANGRNAPSHPIRPFLVGRPYSASGRGRHIVRGQHCILGEQAYMGDRRGRPGESYRC